MQSDCRFDALQFLNYVDSTTTARRRQTNFTNHNDFERSKFFNVCSLPNHLIASFVGGAGFEPANSGSQSQK